MNSFARKCLKCRANERNQVYLIAECSRHYENLIKAPRVKHGGAKQAAREGEIEAADAEAEGEAEEIAQTGRRHGRGLALRPLLHRHPFRRGHRLARALRHRPQRLVQHSPLQGRRRSPPRHRLSVLRGHLYNKSGRSHFLCRPLFCFPSVKEGFQKMCLLLDTEEGI